MTRFLTRLAPFALAALALCAAPTTADAKAGLPYGWAEQLTVVAPTRIPTAAGTQMSLCHQTKKYHIAFIGLFRKSQGYVLSEAGCSTHAEFYELDAQGLAEAKAAGMIARDVPSTPRLSLMDLASGFAIWPLIAIFGGWTLVSSMRSNRRRAVRQEIFGLGDGPVFRFLDAMCHAARADNRTEPEEVDYILGVARDLTGLDYTHAHIKEAIAQSQKSLDKAAFKRFGAGLNAEQRRMVMHGALTVVASDGSLSKAERKFVNGLATGLKLPQDDMDSLVSRVFGHFMRPAAQEMA